LILPQSSTFFRRSALDLIGGEIDEDINYATDFNMWLKMICKGVKMLYVNRFFSSFRVHGGSMNVGNVRGNEEKRECIRRLMKNPDYEVKMRRKALSGIYFREGKKRSKIGMPVLKCCLMMVFYNSSLLLHPKVLLRRLRRMGLL